MQEIELKFQVPAARRAAVDAAVAGQAKAPRMRLQAAYFDTADRALAKAGLALRIRREGRRVVQTLKGLGDDGLTRAEHNVDVPPGRDPEGLADPALHAGTPVGERLLALLAKAGGAPLTLQFRTDVRRRSREMRTRLGVVELAFDEGAIVAGDRREPVCELEIELVRGSPLAVIATARQWVLRHGLWLDTRSKAERGDMLARGESTAPERKAAKVRLSDEMTVEQALRLVLLSCLDQIAVNASQVATGRYQDEHVHQLRIGLRRLRSALRLFDVEPVRPALTEQAAILFRRLGAARDRVAVVEPLERELHEALADCGLHFDVPHLPMTEDIDPADIVKVGPAQMLLLGLYEWTQTGLQTGTQPAPPSIEPAAQRDTTSCRELLVRKLKRLHRSVESGLGQFDSLDDPARHRLRKRAKRLRYGVEFGASLFGKRAVRGYLEALKETQDRLGAFVDLNVAMQAYKAQDMSDARVLFALGWLAACKKALIADMGKVAAGLRKAPRFWKS